MPMGLSLILFISAFILLVIGYIFIWGLPHWRTDPNKPDYSWCTREKHYQQVFARIYPGDIEVAINDPKGKARVDYIGTLYHENTAKKKKYAVEFDYARKIHEAYGQAIDYSRLTGYAAGIVLIITKANDWEKYEQLLNLIEHGNYPVDVWTIDATRNANP